MIRRRTVLTWAAAAATGGFGLSQARASDSLPDEISGVHIPDSAIAQAAADKARAEMPKFLFNHCVRIFVWGSLVAAQKGWTYDADVAFVASVLHDIGLIEKYEVEGVRFEQAGGEAVKQWGIDNGLTAAQAETVFNAIALHTKRGTENNPSPEVAMAHIGAAVDFLGEDPFYTQVLPDLARTLDALPRENFNDGFVGLLRAHAARKPTSAAASVWINPFLAFHKDGDKIGPWEE